MGVVMRMGRIDVGRYGCGFGKGVVSVKREGGRSEGREKCRWEK